MIRDPLQARSRRWLAGLVSVGALLAGIAMASPASAASYVQIFPGCGGSIHGYGSLCLDDRFNLYTNYQPVQEYQCNSTGAQAWQVFQSYENPAADVILLGATMQSGPDMCLDVRGAGTADGTSVDIYDCNNTPAQDWAPEPGGALYNPKSGKCLDDPNWATDGHTQLQIWDCNGQPNQVWLGDQ